jgi:hypothetical protein
VPIVEHFSRAKELALDCLSHVRRGIDPLSPPTASMAFAQLAGEYQEAHRKRHSETWTKEIDRVLRADILPSVNGHRSDAITRNDVARVIEGIARRGSYQAANLTLTIVRGIVGCLNLAM